MKRKEIEETVIRIFAQVLSVPEDKVSIKSKLVDDLGMDSMNAVEVQFNLKEKFKNKINIGEEFRSIRTIEDIVDLIETKLGDKERKKRG